MSSLPCVSEEGGRDGGCAGAAGTAQVTGLAGRGSQAGLRGAAGRLRGGGGAGRPGGGGRLSAVSGGWADSAKEPAQSRPEKRGSWVICPRLSPACRNGRFGREGGQPGRPPAPVARRCLHPGSLRPPASPACPPLPRDPSGLAWVPVTAEPRLAPAATPSPRARPQFSPRPPALHHHGPLVPGSRGGASPRVLSWPLPLEGKPGGGRSGPRSLLAGCTRPHCTASTIRETGPVSALLCQLGRRLEDPRPAL